MLKIQVFNDVTLFQWVNSNHHLEQPQCFYCHDQVQE